MSINREIILVTGAASGIGFAISERLASDDRQVIALDINHTALKKTVNQLGSSVIGYHCDVTDEQWVNETTRSIIQKHGKITVLINNAGISVNKALESTTLQEWNRVIDTNLTGVFIMTKAFVDQLAQTDNGLVINIASVSGMVGMPNYLAYNVSKAGVIELTKTLAIELAPRIRVNAICPGYILTPMQQREYTDTEIAQCANLNPLKRLGQINEIAAMVEFLMSAEATYINGSALVIDGGETAGGLASSL
jgi:NAD(P)-dependent dehydrogenase (short-subunit alcohol dehydrogenase family)